MANKLKIFSDLSHPQLAQDVCRELGMGLGKSEIITFSNDNLVAEVYETVRGGDVFVLGTQAPIATHNFFSFCVLLNALHYASAQRVTAVTPYLFESRSDKKDRPRIAIVARLVAQFLEAAGADRILAMDLHAPQIQGFFRRPMDVLDAAFIICEFLKQRDLDNYVLVAGDAGEMKKLDSFLKLLPREMPVAMFDKRRRRHDEKPTIVGFIGEVGGRTALIVDDEITSGGTIREATEFFGQMPKEKQPAEIRVAVTHPVLTGKAMDILNQCGIKELIAVDTIPVPMEKQQNARFEFNLLSCAKLFAQAIKLIHEEGSVSQLWQP